MIIRIERGRIAGFGRCPLIHLRQERCERAERMDPTIVDYQTLAQNPRLAIVSGRLEERRSCDVDLLLRMAGGQRFVEKRVCFLEAVEALREPRTQMKSRAGSIGRQCDRLFGDSFGTVMVRDAAEQVAAKKQQVRQCLRDLRTLRLRRRAAPSFRSTTKDWRRRFARSYSVLAASMVMPASDR